MRGVSERPCNHVRMTLLKNRFFLTSAKASFRPENTLMTADLSQRELDGWIVSV